ATGKLSYDGAPNITNKNHLATIMSGYEILLEMFDMIDHPAFKKTWTDYCKFYSMPDNDKDRTAKSANWGNNNFLIPRLTAYAAKELNDKRMAERAWNELLEKKHKNGTGLTSLYNSKLVVAPEVLNPIHENTMVGTNGTSQWGLNAIIMLELIGNKIPESRNYLW
ncbi:MAG: hypothetical protein WCJ61_14470, partial [Paludibacter sp.]